MLSMTGYGEARADNQRLRVEVRMRGVNHRYLDLVLRLPELLRPHEARLREVLSHQLHRGRVEVALELRRLVVEEAEVEVDRAALAALRRVAEELRAEGTIAAAPSLGDLMRFPDLLRLRRESLALEGEDLGLVVSAVEDALAAFVASRRSEGDKLGRVISDRLAELATLSGRLESMSVEAQRELEEGLRRRLSELMEETVLPEERIAQEVVVLLERVDVREELDRLQVHVSSCAEILDLPGPQGKRLDFLAQEILRELNTLAAKCRSTVMVGSVLEGKLICEQLREQVQNVE